MPPHGGPTRGSAQPAKKRARPTPPAPPIVFERDVLSDDSNTSDASSDSALRRQRAQPPLVARHLLHRAEAPPVPQGGAKDARPSSSPRSPTFEVDELDSTDEDVDSDADVDLSPSGGAEEPGGNDYRMFLRAVLGEGATPEENAIPDGTSNELNRLLDDEDDFDFDYLRESALVPEDPFEYRDDRGVHVSHKEIVQLHDAGDSFLRPRTRNAAPSTRIPPTRRHLSSPSFMPFEHVPQYAFVRAPPVLPLPHAHALPPPIPQAQFHVREQLEPSHPASLIKSAQGVKQSRVQQKIPGRLAQSRSKHKEAAAHTGAVPPLFTVAPPIGALRPITNHDIARLREQYVIHIHLLSAVHADASHIVTSPPVPEPQPERSVAQARTVVAKTTALANSLISMRETASGYWRMLCPYQSAHAQSLACGAVFTGTLAASPENSDGVSLFDAPGIKSLPGFLAACRGMKAESLPLAVVREHMGPYLHAHIAKKLSPSPVRLNLSSALKEGERPWTTADDQLLAMTLAKHTREFGALSKDLLPHRTVEDCQVRVRYLSSRRCGDNPVKRHVTFNSVPLTKAELCSIEHYLKMFGKGSDKNAEVWKSIQRDHLPTRDWSYLQKLWHIRESRRQYKASYRKKLKAKGAGTEQRGGSGAPSKSSRGSK